jgi:S-(hydroxymethyl)glutathione dehydrogenase/alcohol dehydrogenase
VIEGALAYPRPIVLGHEGAGVVEAVGAQVTLARRGDHVVCSWNPSCGHCFYCDRGQPILCEVFTRTQPKGFLLDGTSRLSLGGRPVHHFSAMSSHAEYCVVHASSAVVVPDEIPFDRACLIGCGVATGVVRPRWRGDPGSSVLVIGAGGRAERGAGGGSRAPRHQARRPTSASRHAAVRRAVPNGRRDRVALGRRGVGGRGADYAIEAGGREATFRLAVEAVRPGGTVVFLGKVNVDQPVSLRWGSLMGEKRIVRSSYGGARPRRDFPWLARLYLEGRLKLDELITQRLPLAQVNDGFAAMTKGEVVRAVLGLN